MRIIWIGRAYPAKGSRKALGYGILRNRGNVLVHVWVGHFDIIVKVRNGS